MKRVFTFLFAAVVAISASHAHADLMEDFSHPDGSLTGQTPTPGPGGVWTNHSGTSGDLQVVSGEAVVQHGVPSEDTHAGFGSFSSGEIFATFDITVTDDSVITGGDYEYFAHFMEEGTFDFFARLSVVEANVAAAGVADY